MTAVNQPQVGPQNVTQFIAVALGLTERGPE